MKHNPYQPPAPDPDAVGANPAALSVLASAMNGLFAGVLYGSITAMLLCFAGGGFALVWDWRAAVGEHGGANAAIALLFGMASTGAMIGAVVGACGGCFIWFVVRIAGPKPAFWADYICQVAPTLLTLSTLVYLFIYRAETAHDLNFALFVVMFFLVIAGSIFFSDQMTSLSQRKIWEKVSQSSPSTEHRKP